MKEIFNFTLRIDKNLHEEILKIAEKNKRSLNSEILIAIEKYIKKEKDSSN